MQSRYRTKLENTQHFQTQRVSFKSSTACFAMICELLSVQTCRVLYLKKPLRVVLESVVYYHNVQFFASIEKKQTMAIVIIYSPFGGMGGLT